MYYIDNGSIDIVDPPDWKDPDFYNIIIKELNRVTGEIKICDELLNEEDGKRITIHGRHTRFQLNLKEEDAYSITTNTRIRKIIEVTKNHYCNIAKALLELLQNSIGYEKDALKPN